MFNKMVDIQMQCLGRYKNLIELYPPEKCRSSEECNRLQHISSCQRYAAASNKASVSLSLVLSPTPNVYKH